MADRRKYRATALLILGLLTAGPALAQTRPPATPAAPAAPASPKPLGTFDGWTSAELGGGNAKVCYMFARPADSLPKGARRGEIMVVVTHRPGAKRQDEVSFQAGYAFKENAPVAVEVDGKKFDFFSDGESAWAKDPAADKTIVTALRSGTTLKVRGTSQRDTQTTDTFSLNGFTKAYAEIGKACGVK